MTLDAALWDLGLPAIGVILGYAVAVKYDRHKTKKESDKAHSLSMNALVSSLKTNSKYIHQMFTVEFPAGVYPSYRLDSTALSFIVFGIRPYLPKNTDWPGKFNRLRFEMEHINRRLLMELIGRRSDPNQMVLAYQEYVATGQMPSPGFATLIIACQKAIDDQVQELEKFGYKGEVVEPY